MRSRHLLYAGIFVLGVGTLIELPYYVRSRGWLPGRWDTVEAGPVQGVAWKELSHRKDLREAGEVFSLTNHVAKPYTFVYRTPEETGEAEAFLVADGDELPLPSEVHFQDRHFRGVQPLREYPPNLDALEIVVRPKEGAPSRFRVRDLPPTQYRFPINRPEEAYQTRDGLSFQASAWTSPPKKGFYPYVAVALRVGNDLPPGNWEWRDIRLDFPYRSPDDPRDSSGGYSMKAKIHQPTLGTVQAHPWARRMPRVRLSGRLSRFETMKETVDFGEFEIGRTKEYAKKDFGLLNLTKPVVAQTPSGLRLRLEPLKDYNTTHDMTDSFLGVRLFVEGETARTGFPTAQTAKGELDVQVGFAGHSISTGIPQQAPVANDYGPTTYIPNATFKPGKLRLRLEVSRRVAVREAAFELYPNVVHRSDMPTSTRSMGNFYGPNAGGAFLPSPEDFSNLRTAHN